MVDVDDEGDDVGEPRANDARVGVVVVVGEPPRGAEDDQEEAGEGEGEGEGG